MSKGFKTKEEYEDYEQIDTFKNFEKIEKTKVNLRIKTFNGKKFNKTRRESKLKRFDKM